jgi:hypothetical protein
MFCTSDILNTEDDTSGVSMNTLELVASANFINSILISFGAAEAYSSDILLLLLTLPVYPLIV